MGEEISKSDKLNTFFDKIPTDDEGVKFKGKIGVVKGRFFRVGEGKDKTDFTLNEILKGLDEWKKANPDKNTAHIYKILIAEDKSTTEKLAEKNLIRQVLTKLVQKMSGTPDERVHFDQLSSLVKDIPKEQQGPILDAVKDIPPKKLPVILERTRELFETNPKASDRACLLKIVSAGDEYMAGRLKSLLMPFTTVSEEQKTKFLERIAAISNDEIRNKFVELLDDSVIGKSALVAHMEPLFKSMGDRLTSESLELICTIVDETSKDDKPRVISQIITQCRDLSAAEIERVLRQFSKTEGSTPAPAATDAQKRKESIAKDLPLAVGLKSEADIMKCYEEVQKALKTNLDREEGDKELKSDLSKRYMRAVMAATMVLLDDREGESGITPRVTTLRALSQIPRAELKSFIQWVTPQLEDVADFDKRAQMIEGAVRNFKGKGSNL